MSAANEDRGKAQQKPPARSRDGIPGSQQSRKGGKTIQNVSKQPETVRNGPAAPAPVQQPEHVPMHGFNAAEIKDFLKTGVEPKAHQYKPEKTPGDRPANPWHKAGAMANGDDFWTKLRKQMANLRQSGGTAQGG